MRATASRNGFDVRAIGGSHTVLLAIDATEQARKGLLGFALKRTGAGRSSWLRGLKVFEDVVPKPKPGRSYSTLEHPIQSFLWGYYGAEPGNSYEFIVRPVYGKPGALRYGDDIAITVETENEDEGTHAVFFNRGAIASQAFADKFGNQCIVVANDAKTVARDRWEIFTHGGTRPTGIDSIAFAQDMASRGAGEILLTSMDRDGTRSGYNLPLTRAIADSVPIPVIASGGVGTLDHLVDGVIEGHASAVLAASIFHFGTHSVQEAKTRMAAAGIQVRRT